MTRPAERNAFEAAFVPVHHRVRALLERHPYGPPPSDAIKAIREAIAPSSDFRDLRDRLQASDQAKTELRVAMEAASPFTPERLRALADRMRSLPTVGRIVPADLDLRPEQLRLLAAHLIHTGVNATEVSLGAILIADKADDADRETLRMIALLGRGLGWKAKLALERTPDAAADLHWVFTRTSWPDRLMWTAALGRQSADAIEDLLSTIGSEEIAVLACALARQDRAPEWFTGHRRFAEALADRATRSAEDSTDAASLTAAADLWDALAYSHAAFLGFEPGEREAAMSMLSDLLRSEQARAIAQHADNSHPDTAWLRWRLDAAHREQPFPAGLALRVAVPPPSLQQREQLHVLVDGLPLIPRLFDSDGVRSPDEVLHRDGGLRAGTKPNDRWIAEAACSEPCCGALDAQITLDETNRRVNWELRRTNDVTVQERVTFDAAVYTAEVARAERDRSWEWPARRTARLLQARLEAEPDVLGRWDCWFSWANSWNRSRDELTLMFDHPAEVAVDGHQIQFAFVHQVPDAAHADDDAAQSIVDHIIEKLRSSDPKTGACVRGASSENAAAALGYSWRPEQRTIS
jgi:hypothetical protein